MRVNEYKTSQYTRKNALPRVYIEYISGTFKRFALAVLSYHIYVYRILRTTQIETNVCLFTILQKKDENIKQHNFKHRN